MTRTPLWVPLACFVACVLFAVQWAQAERRHGEAVYRERIAVAQLDSARATIRRLDGQYRVDTVRLARTVHTRDTLRVTLTLTDTLEVLRYIAASDSVIVACTDALATCEQRVSAERMLALGWRARWEASEALRPTFADRVRVRATWGVGGAVVGLALGVWVAK